MKTTLTKEIENALESYAPQYIAGKKINYFRKHYLKHEIPVEHGTISKGIIDAVGIYEYFEKLEVYHICKASSMANKKLRQIYWSKVCRPVCKRELDDMPPYCAAQFCEMCQPKDKFEARTLFVTYEIKISVSDFRSRHGHNLARTNADFYVVPGDIAEYVSMSSPVSVGIIVYKNGRLRKLREAEYRSLNADSKVWFLMSMMGEGVGKRVV
jgi:hypothetical protein